MQPVELAKEAEKQFKVVGETQKDIFEMWAKMNQHWMKRAATEAKSMTDLGHAPIRFFATPLFVL